MTLYNSIACPLNIIIVSHLNHIKYLEKKWKILYINWKIVKLLSKKKKRLIKTKYRRIIKNSIAIEVHHIKREYKAKKNFFK